MVTGTTARGYESIINSGIESSILNGLYTDGNSKYWLASPSYSADNMVRYVDTEMKLLNGTPYDNSLYVKYIRPIVCIPASAIKIIETEGNIKLFYQ